MVLFDNYWVVLILFLQHCGVPEVCLNNKWDLLFKDLLEPRVRKV